MEIHRQTQIYLLKLSSGIHFLFLMEHVPTNQFNRYGRVA